MPVEALGLARVRTLLIFVGQADQRDWNALGDRDRVRHARVLCSLCVFGRDHDSTRRDGVCVMSVRVLRYETSDFVCELASLFAVLRGDSQWGNGGWAENVGWGVNLRRGTAFSKYGKNSAPMLQ